MGTERCDVVVVGAGVMGSATARSLAMAGREVVVLEKFELGHHFGGSHGGTRLIRAAVDDEEYAEQVERARRTWAEIGDEAGLRLMEITGGLDHGIPDRVVDDFRALFGSHGFAHEVLDPEEAAERWAGMRFETRVLYQPNSGRLLADRAVTALQSLASRHGAVFHPRTPATALRIVHSGDGIADGVVDVDTGDLTLRARQVVITAGSWAPALVSGLVDLPPLTVTQEQPRFFAPRSDGAQWPIFVHWRNGADLVGAGYGVFEEHHGMKVGLHRTGPVVDPDQRDFQPEPKLDAALLRYVADWLPGLDPDRSTPISCLYDTTPRDTFVIDRVGPITVAVGFCGQGFKFAPLVGQYVTDLVTARSPGPLSYRLATHMS